MSDYLTTHDGATEFAVKMSQMGFGPPREATNQYDSRVFRWELTYGEKDHKVANRIAVTFNTEEGELRIYLTAHNGLGYTEARLTGWTPIEVAIATVTVYANEAIRAAKAQG